MRRDLTAALLVALTLLAAVPAYERVFVGAEWRGPALTAGGVALGLAVLVRRLRRGPWLAALLTVLGFVAMAPWLLGATPRPLLPSSEALGILRELLVVGRSELAETPAPAPALPGLMLLVVAGWWMVAHVGHELAVRWQQTGPSLVALTVLWAAPLAVPMNGGSTWQQVVPFLGMAGLTLLLTGQDPASNGRVPVPASGLAVGALALVVAVTMPGLLPGYAEPAWVQLGPGNSPRGYQPIVDVSQRLGLPEERDVLRVLASQPTYLRLAGLESFDGDVWRLGPPGGGSYRPDPASLYPADGLLPPEQPAAATELVQVDIEVLELENIYVPVPYQPVEILGPIRDEMLWSTEGGFLATWDTVGGELDGGPRVGIRQGVEYRVRAARPAPTFDQLTATTFDAPTLTRFTALPRDYPELGELAEQVYADAGATTTVSRALALQDWFVGPDGDFTYDLDVGALRGEGALTEFVLEDRVGYCEYFATAMAVMLRQTGIPARVATGFLPGRVTAPADPAAGRELTEYTVSTADAHAWVEVLFPGSGWVTFEPTPRSDDSQIVPSADDLTPIENIAERQAREAAELDELEADPATPDASDGPDAELPDLLSEGDMPAAGAGGDPAGGATTQNRALALLTFGLLGAVVVTSGVRRRDRRSHAGDRSPQERVLEAQRGLLGVAARHGVPRGEHETAVEVIDRWRRERRIDERGVPVAVVAQAAAFGGNVEAAQAEEVERLVVELEQMLRDSVSPRARVLAPVRVPLGAAADALRRTTTGFHRWWSSR